MSMLQNCGFGLKFKRALLLKDKIVSVDRF
jgi:hypothetical protein